MTQTLRPQPRLRPDRDAGKDVEVLADGRRTTNGRRDRVAREHADVQSLSQLLRLLAIGLLVFFALSGTLKEFPLLSFLPGDLTQLAGIGAFGAGVLYRLDTSSLPSRSQMAMAALFVIVLLSGALGALDTEYGAEKLTKGIQISLLGVMIAALAIRDVRDLALFQKIFFTTAFVVGVPLALGLPGYRDKFGRFSSESGSTINLGQAAGAVLFALAAYFLVRRTSLRLRQVVAMIAVAGVAAYVLLGVGSRGPLQGVVVAVAFAAVASVKTTPTKAANRLTLLTVALVAGVAAIWSATPAASRERIVDFSGNSTADTRVVLWNHAWENVDLSLFGHGFGSYQQIAIGDYTYPHNLFLEFWYETGLVGLVAILVFFAIPIVRRWFTLADHQPVVGVMAAGLIVYYWAGAMVSGDLNDHRALWVVATAAAVSFLPVADHRTRSEGDEVDP